MDTTKGRDMVVSWGSTDPLHIGLKPGSTAPSGSRWVYRINQADHRHCWHLSSKAAITHTHLAHRYHSDPEAARQDQQGGNSDRQTASAPTDNTDVAVAAKPPVMPQAATPSVEQSSDDLVPRSVPTIVYRLPPASAPIVTEPTVPALPVRTVTPAATSRSNVFLLAGAAAAGLCFAGAVFHFTRRVHRSARTRLVADSLVVIRSPVEAMPLHMTSDPAEDVEQSAGEPRRDRQRTREHLPLSDQTRNYTAIPLPHAAAWDLGRPLRDCDELGPYEQAGSQHATQALGAAR